MTVHCNTHLLSGHYVTLPDLWPLLDEDIASIRGPLPQSQLHYRPLVDKLTPHIETFLVMLHEARVKQKQLLLGHPQLLVYK